MSGCRAAASSNMARMKAWLRSTLALSIRVTRPGLPAALRRRARAKVMSNSRSQPRRVTTMRSVALSGSLPAGSWRPANRPSVCSRTISMSTALLVSTAGTPGHSRTGRSPANRPKCSRMPICGAISVPSAARMLGQPAAPNRVASAAAMACRVSAGSASPVSRKWNAPAGCAAVRTVTPDRSAAWCRTDVAASVTSGPMPSPGMTATS